MECLSTPGHYLEMLEKDINKQKDGCSGNVGSLPSRRLPSATEILDFLEQQGPLGDVEDQNDWISNKYMRNANRCFSQLQKAQIRKFEKLMKEATRGRKLFYADGTRFRLGPKIIGEAYVHGVMYEKFVGGYSRP
ncbi:hypothetical protein QBC36DRAFT_347592 [Triangularia setosa]|uniref:Uncharacterized protein n=1 Tax=Triangularia setosa TaxID=2587417 RepID=A0AAN6W424_9PEZI|nr:hypothetical protein QBC36DRAFT_347592 [Podospora setosa]